MDVVSSGMVDTVEEAPLWTLFHLGTTGMSLADVFELNIQREFTLSFGGTSAREEIIGCMFD
jgi:hypothetical protein